MVFVGQFSLGFQRVSQVPSRFAAMLSARVMLPTLDAYFLKKYQKPSLLKPQKG
jgi:hypothetical protein